MLEMVFSRVRSLPVMRLVPAAALAGLVFSSSPALARGTPDGFADLAQRLSPAVVNISTSQTLKRRSDSYGTSGNELLKRFLDENGIPMPPGLGEGNGRRGPTRLQSLGSGFVIDPKGIIVTNYHVIEGADDIEVKFTDGSSLKGKLLGKDEPTDLALVKVEPKRPLTAVRFGDSDRVRVGDWAVAIGNPFGLGGSVTAGIISARGRDIQAGAYDDFIQTDAAINRGNSGGPLFDLDGNVIGINTAIISPYGGSIGLGFATPSNLASRVIAQVLQYGEAKRGWIGVRIQTVTPEIAESLGLDQSQGALVAEVTASSPAAKAGLREGDLILKFDGKNVDAFRSLPRLVAETQIGRTVPVEILRGGKRMSVMVTVGRLDPKLLASASGNGQGPRNGLGEAPGPKGEPTVLGLQLAKPSQNLRRQLGFPADVDGVVVVDIDDESPAAEELRPGDVITEIDQARVRTPQDVANAVKQARAQKKKVVLFMIRRGDSSQFHGIRVDR